MFDPPGDYDESSPFYFFRSLEARALDQSIKARRAAERAATASRNQPLTQNAQLQAKIDDLEDKLLALGLYTRTVLQLLVDQGVVTNEQFQDKLRELDLLDGKLDGR